DRVFGRDRMDTRFVAYLKAFGLNWGTKLSGIASVPLAIASLFVTGFQRVMYAGTAIACFTYSSYELWLNERKARNEMAERLQGVQNHHHLRGEFERLEKGFLACDARELFGFWERRVDSLDVKWSIGDGRDEQIDRLSIVMEEAGNLLMTSKFFSDKFPNVLS